MTSCVVRRRRSALFSVRPSGIYVLRTCYSSLMAFEWHDRAYDNANMAIGRPAIRKCRTYPVSKGYRPRVQTLKFHSEAQVGYHGTPPPRMLRAGGVAINIISYRVRWSGGQRSVATNQTAGKCSHDYNANSRTRSIVT